MESQQSVYKDFRDISFEKMPIKEMDDFRLRASSQGIYEDENGIIWLILTTGLYRYNGHSIINVSKHLSKNYFLEFGNDISTSFLRENDENFWYGTRNGLYKVNLKKHTSKKILLEESLFRNSITLFKKRNDTLFVGTGNGITLINTKTDKVLGHLLDNGFDYGWRMSNKNVHSIMLNIEPGYIWAALGDGLYRINLKTKETEQFVSKTQVWDYSHYYFDGERYKNILLLSSYGMGMTEFDMVKKTFKDYKVDSPGEEDWKLNKIRTTIKLNDTLSLINVSNKGFALFNRYSKEFEFLKTPDTIREEGASMSVDRSGYAWIGRYGNLYRSKKAVVKKSENVKPIIDISALSVSGKLRSRPSIDGYDSIRLNENDDNILLQYNFTHSHLYDKIDYEYSLNGDEWIPIKEPNTLQIFSLKKGKQSVEIQAKNNGKVLANRKLNFEIYQPFYKSPYFIPVCLIFLFGVIFTYREYRNIRKREAEQSKANFENKMLELEAKALRSQINPHFIFNTLNSIKFYTLTKSKDETSDFITKFSALIRQVLENSKQSLISLREEVETLINYMDIEKLRLRNSFNYEIITKEDVNWEFLIPPMILQPFVENAIWHGLMHKEGDRLIKLEFNCFKNSLECIITDNGIGRAAAEEISKNRKHKNSLGINITNDRLEKMSELHNLKSLLEITDLVDDNLQPAGTKVRILFQYM